MYDRKEFQTNYATTKYENVKNDLVTSHVGYWILPNGDVISLQEPMSHCKAAVMLDETIFDECIQTASQTNGLTHFKANLETTATYKRHWFRINSNFGINCSWSKVTEQQLASLKVILDSDDPDCEGEYWWDTGSGSIKQLMQAVKKAMRDG